MFNIITFKKIYNTKLLRLIKKNLYEIEISLNKMN